MSTQAITENETEIIKALRERVSDILVPEQKEDFFLRKWLAARSFDLDKAEEMLRKHINFIKVNGLDNISENYVPPTATDYFHTKMLGYDKEGSVVRILHLGASDIKGLTFSLSKIDSIRFAGYVLQLDGLKQRREIPEDKICHKQVYIFDLQGLSWRSIIQRPVVERTFTLLKNYEAHHPESLKMVYVVNAPSFFSFIHNWLTTVLPESIISKVHILSQENCKEIITKNIDPSILPPTCGGTMTDETGDPNCPSLYKMPLNEPVPESLMLYHMFDLLENDPLAQKAVVENGACLKLENVITEPNSILQWDFQTKGFDICLALNYKADQNSGYKEIIPLHRIECHRIPESGKLTCEKPGIYQLIFDNTYSWFNKKELVYKVAVLLPKINADI